MEPYRLNNNYIDIWAYDTRDGINKRFKVSRIDEVELLDDPWELVEEFPMAEKGLTPDGDHWIWEGDVRGMDGVGRFVLGLPMFIEVLEGDGLKAFLREHARYILNDMGL